MQDNKAGNLGGPVRRVRGRFESNKIQEILRRQRSILLQVSNTLATLMRLVGNATKMAGLKVPAYAVDISKAFQLRMSLSNGADGELHRISDEKPVHKGRARLANAMHTGDGLRSAAVREGKRIVARLEAKE